MFPWNLCPEKWTSRENSLQSVKAKPMSSILKKLNPRDKGKLLTVSVLSNFCTLPLCLSHCMYNNASSNFQHQSSVQIPPGEREIWLKKAVRKCWATPSSPKDRHFTESTCFRQEILLVDFVLNSLVKELLLTPTKLQSQVLQLYSWDKIPAESSPSSFSELTTFLLRHSEIWLGFIAVVVLFWG